MVRKNREITFLEEIIFNRVKMSKGGKPKNWENCPRMSSKAIFDRFVAFKTPYHAQGLQSESGEHFDVSSAFELAKSKGLRIGLVIDITDTNRYYNGAEVEKHNSSYVKLACSGRDIKKLNMLIGKFISLCNGFWEEHPDRLIGVHCTHGFNRTGFLIVCYMVDVCNWNVKAAVDEFARLRPPGIYRENKVKELSRRYGIWLRIPPTPKWASDSRVGHNQNARESVERNWRERPADGMVTMRCNWHKCNKKWRKEEEHLKIQFVQSSEKLKL